MKNTLILTLAVFTTILCKSQDKRFFYCYSYTNDSLDFQNMKKELMMLDIGKRGSFYWSHQIYKHDSLELKGIDDGSKYDSGFADVLDVVVKKHPENETNFYTSPDGYFNVIIKNKIVWNIYPETKQYLGYKIQKATATLYKRNWIAWFTTEIPIQDGPYIFHGLPGLILKIEDAKKTQIFEFCGVQNIPKIDFAKVPFYHRRTVKNIDEKMYKQIIHNYENPQVSGGNEPNNTTYYNVNGEKVSEEDFLREQRRMRQKGRKKFNNFLNFDIIR